MVVHDFDVESITIAPAEADLLLIVYPSAVLALTITLQSLQSIARRHTQVGHFGSGVQHLQAQGADLPGYVQQEFEDYLKCGRLEHGFLRIRCDTCHAEHLVAFSYEKRGFCPSCGARRMTESAALRVDEVFLEQPVRQWVLRVPYPLRFLFASRPEVMGRVLGIVYRCIATHLIKKAGFSRKTAQAGAGGSTPEARAVVSVYQPAGHLGKAPVGDTEWQRPVPAEDAVPRRNHARHLRAP